jgi:hypothetical protein
MSPKKSLGQTKAKPVRSLSKQITPGSFFAMQYVLLGGTQHIGTINGVAIDCAPKEGTVTVRQDSENPYAQTTFAALKKDKAFPDDDSYTIKVHAPQGDSTKKTFSLVIPGEKDRPVVLPTKAAEAIEFVDEMTIGDMNSLFDKKGQPTAEAKVMLGKRGSNYNFAPTLKKLIEHKDNGLNDAKRNMLAAILAATKKPLPLINKKIALDSFFATYYGELTSKHQVDTLNGVAVDCAPKEGTVTVSQDSKNPYAQTTFAALKKDKAFPDDDSYTIKVHAPQGDSTRAYGLRQKFKRCGK